MTTNAASHVHSEAETFFERHAWKVILGVILLIGYFGVGDMIKGAADLQSGETVYMHSVTGMSWNDLQATSPTVARLIDTKFRTEGASLTAAALLGAAICLTGFRKGERWAWFSLWVLPLWMILTVVFILTVEKQPGSGTPVPVISGSVLFVICASMLGLSFRKFFRA